MQCSGCGRPNADDHVFCSWCGSRLGTPRYGQVPEPPTAVEPAKKDMNAPLACMIIGAVVVVIGIVIYGLAISDAFNSVSGTDPYDPFGGFENVSQDVGLIFASYAVMAIGGLIFFVGIILLVVRLP